MIQSESKHSTLYSFTNAYLSGIHPGIQTAHLVHTIKSRADLHDGYQKVAYDVWLEEPYIEVLCGGDHATLVGTFQRTVMIACAKLGLPCGIWYESPEAMNGACTAMGFILPWTIKDEVKYMMKMKHSPAPGGRMFNKWYASDLSAEKYDLYIMTRNCSRAS